ncbi:MAG: CBS domain-containing protein [Candidatus Altiarchaeota archaeon]|nr:CBS domain-containing protein [Candidatus Altiarchaeota archaeon]
MVGLTPYDYARKKVVYCWLDEPVSEAAKRMASENIGSLIVDDKGGKHVGMLTDVVLFTAISSCANICNMKVRDLSLEPLVSAPMKASIEEVMEKLDRTVSGRIALLDDDGEIAAVLKKKNLERFARFEVGEKLLRDKRQHL